MSGMYKEVGEWEGVEVGGGGGWAVGVGLYPPLGLFGLAISPRSASHRLNILGGPKRCFTTTGVNFRPMHMPSM